MNIERYAAFTNGDQGGNPAGVVISDVLPDASAMQRIAAEVGYSETVFAAPEDGAWRVRYFAPQIEIPFCGHATIALGSALALRHGSGRFDLRINDGDVAVEGTPESAVLQSMPATHRATDPAYLRRCMELFGFESDDLDGDIPPAIINAGSNHMLLALSSRATLAAMRYDLEKGRETMAVHRLATIMLVHKETDRLYHARNPFASGGVYEDPATGSAAAAFAGYLRAQDAEPGVQIEIRQGDDMGVPTRLIAEIPGQLNAPVRVSGAVRKIAG